MKRNWGLLALLVAGSLYSQVIRTDPPSTAPVGGATAAKQDTGNASLASIDGKITAVNTGAVTIAGGSLAANQSTNVAQIAGTTPDTNSGLKSAGTLRVVLATDQPALTNKLLVTPDSVALPANQSVNVSQIAGTTPDTNSGVKSAGTLRVVLATDQPALTNKLLVTPDSVALPANQSVNVSQINGVTPLMGNGVTGTGSHRVTISSDNSAVSGLGAGATGSAVPANAVQIGLRDDAGNLRAAIRCDLRIVVDQAFTAAQSVQLVAAVASQKIYVCHASFATSAASSIKLTEGTGTNCGTGKASVTGAYPLAANGGVVLPFGINPLEITTAADALCIESSAAATVAGVIQYAQF